MPKLTVIYEDAGFKAVRELGLTIVNIPGSEPLVRISPEQVAEKVRGAVLEVRQAKDDHHEPSDNILPGPGGIPA